MLAWYCRYVPYVVGHLIHQKLDLKLNFCLFIIIHILHSSSVFTMP